jgi:hypothetical protein
MAKTEVPALVSPGSRPLRNSRRERYCRSRAAALPRIAAYREAGWTTIDDDAAYSNGCRLERRPEIRDRIAYLTRQAEEMIAVKRQRVESQLWSIAEGNIQDFFEEYLVVKRNHEGRTETDENGAISHETRARPRSLATLPRELAALIEEVRVDNRGRLVPKLYSKTWANKELRNFLVLDKPPAQRDVTQLSDAELISTLAAQAKELGITIDLNYKFAQQPPAAVTDDQEGLVTDVEGDTPSTAVVVPPKR